MHSYEWAETTIASARNRDNGKPLANNTRLYDRGDHYAVQLHATDVVKFYPNGEVELNTGGWFTNTTRDRINSYSPVGVSTENGTWYLDRVYRTDEPEPSYSYRKIPKPFTAVDPGPEPVDTGEGCVAGTEHWEDGIEIEDFMRRDEAEAGGYEITRATSDDYVWVKRLVTRVTEYGEQSYRTPPSRGVGIQGQYAQCAHCKGFQEIHRAWSERMNGSYYNKHLGYRQMQDNLELYGSMEGWQEAYITEFREVRAARKAHREWQARNRIEFYDGIRVKDGEVVEAKSVEDQQRDVAERDEMKRKINRYVDGFVKALEEGMPVPSSGDCWYCSMRTVDDGTTMGDLGDPSDHLLAHIEEEYYVPSLAFNAVSEKGYQYPGVILGYDPETELIGGRRMITSSVRRAIETFMKKRLITGAAPVARIHAASDR